MNPQTQFNEAIQAYQPVSREIIFHVIASGMVEAVVFWFNLYLDENILVTSKPGGDLQHWGQPYFVFQNRKAYPPAIRKLLK